MLLVHAGRCMLQSGLARLLFVLWKKLRAMHIVKVPARGHIQEMSLTCSGASTCLSCMSLLVVRQPTSRLCYSGSMMLQGCIGCMQHIYSLMHSHQSKIVKT
jgi:hypothetical protein